LQEGFEWVKNLLVPSAPCQAELMGEPGCCEVSVPATGTGAALRQNRIGAEGEK